MWSTRRLIADSIELFREARAWDLICQCFAEEYVTNQDFLLGTMSAFAHVERSHQYK